MRWFVVCSIVLRFLALCGGMLYYELKEVRV